MASLHTGTAKSHSTSSNTVELTSNLTNALEAIPNTSVRLAQTTPQTNRGSCSGPQSRRTVFHYNQRVRPALNNIKAREAKSKTPTAMNLACKIGLATVAIAATLAIACTPLGLSEPESTRRPTSTPAPAVPTQIPLYSTMAPTVDPNLFQEIGGEERLSGPAVTEYETGRTLMSNGDYQAAVAAFSRAQIHHGKPSFALESWIGLAFHKLNDHTQVIAHLTVAIAIEDSATNQVNRATSYLRTGRCDLAINDANQALAMTPEYTEASHTDVQAHLVLGGCHIINGNPGLGMFHLQAALEVAKENGYRSGVTAAIHVLIGERQYSNEKYTEAIEHYSKAIALNDTADARVGRALAYSQIADCTTANVDSRKALTLPPVAWSQYNTDAEANAILAICYSRRGELQRALQHADAAQQIMRENGHPAEDFAELTMIEGAIRSAMGP